MPSSAQNEGRFPIALGPDNNIEYLALVVDGTREILDLASNPREDLVEMPAPGRARASLPKAHCIDRADFHPHRRTVSYVTLIPRSASKSSTSR